MQSIKLVDEPTARQLRRQLVRASDISQFETDISQFETDISQFGTDIS